MKKVFFGSVAATGAILLSGCCGYQGYAEYDAPTELSRENERVTAEREGIRLEGGAVKVEKLVDYSYDQNLQIDTKKASLYTEGSGVQVVGNFICYPLTLVSSPIRLLVMEDKIKKELGHEYKYTYGRQVWNMFNPLICVLGDYKEETEIVSSKKAKEKRTRTERTQIKDGKIQFTCGNKKKELSTMVTVQELYQTAFEYPLPLKEAKVTLTYNGKSYDFPLKSSDMLAAGDLAAWDNILKCQDAALLKDGSIMASLETLHKDKKISDSDCRKEADRLNGLLKAQRGNAVMLCQGVYSCSLDFAFDGEGIKEVPRSKDFITIAGRTVAVSVVRHDGKIYCFDVEENKKPVLIGVVMEFKNVNEAELLKKIGKNYGDIPVKDAPYTSEISLKSKMLGMPIPFVFKAKFDKKLWENENYYIELDTNRIIGGTVEKDDSSYTRQAINVIKNSNEMTMMAIAQPEQYKQVKKEFADIETLAYAKECAKDVMKRSHGNLELYVFDVKKLDNIAKREDAAAKEKAKQEELEKQQQKQKELDF